MFLLKTYNFIVGYSEIEVEGFFVERFVNLCSFRGIKIWDIDRKTAGIIKLKILEKDLKKVYEILNTTRSQMRILKKVGVPNFLKSYKKRKVFLCVSLICMIIIYFLSLHIWNIEVVGNEVIPTDEIKSILYEEGIRIGKNKDEIDFEKVKNEIYIRRKDVAWIGINLKGVKITIEVLEKKTLADESLKDVPTNIVANKEGMIEKISVRAGTRCVNVGDVVCKGDLLVSGIMKSEHSENIMVNSDAEIKIKTWYTTKTAVPYEKTVLLKSGSVDKKYKIKIGNYAINLANNSTNFEKYDTINLIKKLVLFGKIETPISLETIVYEELVTSDIKYTKEQAENVAKKEVYDLVMKSMPEDAEVLEHQYKVFEKDDSVIVRITTECLESIGVEEKLTF